MHHGKRLGDAPEPRPEAVEIIGEPHG
jgi:hypothetical protein